MKNTDPKPEFRHCYSCNEVKPVKITPDGAKYCSDCGLFHLLI